MVYGQIMNFEDFRLSNLDSIFLLAAINSKNLDDQSYDRILIPVFEQIKSVNENIESPFFVELQFVSADTPAAQSLGGFVEGVGNANNPCRECPIDKKYLTKICNSAQCERRSYESTKSAAKMINQNKKVINGIKRYTLLYEYPFFDPINMTPQDPMHCILEGLDRRIAIDFFKLWIETKRCDISELNSKLSNFNYGFFYSKNKIKPLNESDLYKMELTITASQMKTLIHLFPLIFWDIADITSNDYK